MVAYNKGLGRGVAWLREHMDYQGDDCLIWPFSRDPNGRGRVGYNGELWWTHRLMCVFIHGNPPTPQHEARHSCGKSHLGCVNPRHISWATKSENQKDRRRHGTAATNKFGPKGRLTLAQRRQIAALKGRQKNEITAKQFGCSMSSVIYWQKRA